MKKAETPGGIISLIVKWHYELSEHEAYVTYSSDSTLHWKTVNEKGVSNESNEVISYKRLNDNLHF